MGVWGCPVQDLMILMNPFQSGYFMILWSPTFTTNHISCSQLSAEWLAVIFLGNNEEILLALDNQQWFCHPFLYSFISFVPLFQAITGSHWNRGIPYMIPTPDCSSGVRLQSFISISPPLLFLLNSKTANFSPSSSSLSSKSHEKSLEGRADGGINFFFWL